MSPSKHVQLVPLVIAWLFQTGKQSEMNLLHFSYVSKTKIYDKILIQFFYPYSPEVGGRVKNKVIEKMAGDPMLLNIFLKLIRIRMNPKEEPCILKLSELR